MLARRVTQTEREKKATPPRKSLRFLLFGGVDCCANCDDSDGVGTDWGSCVWLGLWEDVSCGFGALESELELEPQPKRETIAEYEGG